MIWTEVLSVANEVLFYLAISTLLICLAIAWVVVCGYRSIVYLRSVAPSADEVLPKISIIVPARNEARDIEPALQSLLDIDYQPLEIIVVNDRSTDSTGEILDRMAQHDDRLNVHHLSDLPAGWLGKNHALQYAADRASGELLLFTDADIVMEPSTLRRAVAYAREHQVDHLAVTPEVQMPTWLLESFVLLFLTYFSVWYRPWSANNPRSKAYVGIGAFNLIRSEVYHAIDGHRRIAMRPDDDVMLGKVIKRSGFRQHLVNGLDQIRVPWYASLREAIVGLEKNAFAGAEYSVALTVVSSLIGLVYNAWPFAAIFVTTGATQVLYLLCVAVLLIMGFIVAGEAKLRRHAALGLPIAVLIFVYIQWRTMLLTLWQGGIRWRDTLYPLAELKANKV